MIKIWEVSAKIKKSRLNLLNLKRSIPIENKKKKKKERQKPVTHNTLERIPGQCCNSFGFRQTVSHAQQFDDTRLDDET